MSNIEKLLQIVHQLPEDKVQELERIAISMLPSKNAVGQARPGKTFDDAIDSVFTRFDKAFRGLAK